MHFFDSRICKSFAIVKFLFQSRNQGIGNRLIPMRISCTATYAWDPANARLTEKGEAASKQKRPACAASARAPMPKYR
jgi:hypothetical protein